MKNIILLCLTVACAASAQSEACESRTVQTAQGPVRGYKNDDKDIFFFYGIPYATAPTGTRKFTAPLPGPEWKQPFEAVTKNIVCPQGKHQSLNLTGYEEREDCLLANVYMPDTNETNLSVLVYVHGGGYVIGFGEALVPTALVRTKKVVAVTFNYRLGVHGFLCLGTEGAPGNAGMKDQVALLRWVQKNIANFGGNPNDVTIGGFSAGSSAVDLLMLSGMTEGLYNKAIPESGASVGVWSVQIDPVQNAKNFAKQLNFDNVDNITALEEFYSNLWYDALTSDVFFDRIDSTFVFTPCVEGDTGVEKFLEDAPVNILAQGKNRKVPVLYGFANMEGLFRIGNFLQWKNGMNEKFSDFLPADLQFKDDKEKEELAQRIKKFYFGDEIVSETTMQGYIDYFSDIMFAYPHLRAVKLQVDAGSDSIYLYEFSYYKPYPNNIGLPDFMKNVRGAGHCAQSFVVHESNKFIGFPDNSEDFKTMKRIMIELWLNFITTGKPVPEGSKLPPWPPVGANRSPHMDLDLQLNLKGSLNEKRARFWDDIYQQFYRPPMAPLKLCRELKKLS